MHYSYIYCKIVFYYFMKFYNKKKFLFWSISTTLVKSIKSSILMHYVDLISICNSRCLNAINQKAKPKLNQNVNKKLIKYEQKVY